MTLDLTTEERDWLIEVITAWVWDTEPLSNRDHRMHLRVVSKLKETK